MKKYIKILACDRVNDEFVIKVDNRGGNYKIYYTDKPELNLDKKFLLESNEKEIRVKDPIMGKRTYFIMQMEGYEDEIFAERKLPLKGCCNFRDLGGFITKDNRRVKWDKFYRADQLNALTDEDLIYLDSVGLKAIIDYRGVKEAENEKDRDITGAEYINVPAMNMDESKAANEKFDFEFLIKNANSIPEFANPVAFLAKGYEKMPFDNKAFKKIIELTSESDTPFVQHCKSGKDRTGVGSALILLILGVDLNEVKEDYMASNFYRRNYNEHVKEKYKAVITDKKVEELFNIILEVKNEYFDAFINAILAKYNTLEEYFEKEYDLDIDKINKLRNEYLY